jgi:RNA polymerase sigma factor (sigma-70 family)
MSLLVYVRLNRGCKALQQIFLRALSGDKLAEDELFAILRVRFASLAKLKGGGEYAEDLAQEACLTVLQKYKSKSLHGYQDFIAWAHKVLRNKIGNYYSRTNRWKKRMVDFRLSFADVQSIDFSGNALLEKNILDCLKRLKQVDTRYARILNLIHQGYSTDEICESLGINRNYLYVLLHRSRALMSNCLESIRD